MSATTRVPIWVFDETDSLVAIVPNYETAYFERDWQSAGMFEIVINANLPSAIEFKRSRTVLFGDDKRRFGIITQVIKTIDGSGKGGEKTSVTGYEMKKVFDWRIVAPLTGADYFTFNAPAETIMHNLVKYQADPATVGATRGFTKLVRDTDNAGGLTYLLSSRWTKTVLEELYTCSVSTGWGSWIEYVVTGPLTFQWRFRTSGGVNRTAGQSVNGRIIFNTEYGSLREATLTDSDLSYKSYAYVGGQGDLAARVIRSVYTGATEPADRARREMFVDARDLQLTASLDARGASKLAENSFSVYIDGTALALSQFTLGVDYDLGDLCTVSQFGIDSDVQITKVKESWGANVYDIELTFDKEYPDVSTTIKTNASDASGVSASTELSPTMTASKTYDLTSADIAQTLAETAKDVLVLGGSIGANRTVTLYLDANNNGNKKYTVVVPAATLVASSGGPFTVTITTGIAGKTTVAVPICKNGDALLSGGLQFDIFVDSVGNVTYGEWEISGSNSNGSYVKFDDGTMICRVALGAVSMASGTTYTWTFPAAFVSTTDLAGGCDGMPQNVAETFLFSRCPAATYARYYQYNAAGTTQNILSFSMTAIGRWR